MGKPPRVTLEISRRQFIAASSFGTIGMALSGCKTIEPAVDPNAIIDIHQHAGYSGRPDEMLLSHQREMGITKTILLPAGRDMTSTSTHDGVSNGLQAKCLGNEACYQFAKAHPAEFYFGANEVPDAPGAIKEIEKYLKLGAVIVAESKFGVECDSSQMQDIYRLAAHYRVPVLMHWQYKMYNYGFERFYKVLEKYSKTIFIGHAQTWWANIDKAYVDNNKNLYPKGKVTPGGITDRYLRDYANMFGDLSAGSGLNALKRDPDHARDFLLRHQDKLIYGSDCNDLSGFGCEGAQTIAALRRLAPSKEIERKLLHGNAMRVFRL